MNAADPQARVTSETSGGGRRDAALACRADDRLRGISPEGPKPGGQRQDVGVGSSVNDVADRHERAGQRAGFVKNDGVDAVGALENLGLANEHAHPGQAAGADEEGGRRRQSERTRARNHEDSDGGGEPRSCLPAAG